MLHRRSFFLAAATLAPAFVSQSAQAQGAAISAIRVDVAPLARRGWSGPTLAAFERALQGALRSAFAGRMSPAGPTLVVRIDSVALAAYAGADAVAGRGIGGGGGASQNDSIDGELLLVGSGNAVLSRKPLLAVLPSFTSASWRSPDGEVRRVTALASAYAEWARRALG